MINAKNNLYIITSCMKPTIGVFNSDERISQTIESIESVRNADPNSIIFLCDNSVFPLTEDQIGQVKDKVDAYLDFSRDDKLLQLSKAGYKSEAESLLLIQILQTIKQNEQLMRVITSVKRIFKLSGRYKIQKEFNIDSYEGLFGKYVFKSRIPSWLDETTQKNLGSTHLLVTRLFSFCPSLIDNYIEVLIKNFTHLHKGLDTEHAHFLSIDKQYLVEFDRVYCQGYTASKQELLID